MDLFQKGTFTSHAGLQLKWKIECDAISDDEWDAFAIMIIERETRPFSDVIGIPRGGVKLETALLNYVSGNNNDPVLIVDDVWTTGTSFKEFSEIQTIQKMTEAVGWFGWCIFARSATNNQVTSLFQMPSIKVEKQ
jgi:hypothetical protein